MDSRIGVYKGENVEYPNTSEFFRPSVRYPEFETALFQEYANTKNEVYDAVRNTLILLGYDEENIGTKNWNPLKHLVSPGNKIVIKPNLVMHVNRSGDGEDCLYTHPSVVAPIIDYCILALKDNEKVIGNIILGDAPMQECDFDVLVGNSGYADLVDFYRRKGINIELKDFRNIKTEVQHGVHVKKKNEDNGIVVSVGTKSNFSEMKKKRLKRLRITNYDPHILLKHHNELVHEYKVAKEILDADVIINMPKPKTHRKAGVTIALKNIVGISANKEYLPHHTSGSKQEGGDAYLHKNIFFTVSDLFLDKKNEYAHNERFVMAKIALNFADLAGAVGRRIKKDYREGSWYGNDTIWRTIYDLNNIIFMANKEGIMTGKVCRKMLIVADMIVSGEKDGPLCPSRKECGVIAIGENPALFDEAVCTLMGIDVAKIPTLLHLRDKRRLPWFNSLDERIIHSNNQNWDKKKITEISRENSLKFEENPGWKQN